MKRHLVNKDFIPISFIESQMKNGSKGDRRGLMILTVTALILLPFLFSNLFSKKNKDEVSKEVVSIQDRSLNKWLDFMDENFEGEFSKEGAIIIIEGQEKLRTLLEKQNIIINSMEDIGAKKYRLQISQK